MSNMSALIDVFRMNEISSQVRVKIISQLGQAINNELGGNYTERLVVELVKQLDPESDLLKTEHYKRYVDEQN